MRPNLPKIEIAKIGIENSSKHCWNQSTYIMVGNKMTEALQRSVESIQTADFFDIAQNCPKDEVQNCYSYADTDMQNAVDMDAHTESCRYILIYTMRYIHIHDAFTRTVLWIAQIPHPPQD